MNTTLAAVGLLNDIADLGLAVQSRPLHLSAHIVTLGALQARLDADRAAQVATRFLLNFAPPLLHAVAMLLTARGCGDRTNEERWLRVVATFTGEVRVDAGAALDWLAEISKDGSAL